MRLSQEDNIGVKELVAEFVMLDIPGHTVGDVGYYGGKILFCGEALFACGLAR